MNPLQKLLSQTAIYGLSSIIARFLNYLLVPLYTYTFSAGEYGVVSEFYAYAGFFSVLLVFGLETGYFRFRQHAEQETDIYSHCLGFLILTSLVFVCGIAYWHQALANWLSYPKNPEYVLWFGLILAVDALTALPFARLRAQNRAWRFVGIKITEIFITIGLNLFFLLLCPKLKNTLPELLRWYDVANGVAYIFISNVLASTFKLLCLMPEFKPMRFNLNPGLLKKLLIYSLPMIIIGLAGMVNEMLDRAILKFLLPYDLTTNLKLLGIYGACYKLSILMSLFVQAFRYAGEPFFFAYAGRANAQKTYALITRYFVIAGMFIFLFVMLYIDFFKYFIGSEFREGLNVVPILLVANLLLGVYVNLSVWYKLTDHTAIGAWVALAGAALTVYLNILWIPTWGYMGSAWATLACYGFMVVVSWGLGRFYYPVPYPLLRLFFYVGLGVGLYYGNLYLLSIYNWQPWLTGSGCLLFYLLVAAGLEARTLFVMKKASSPS